MNIGSREPIAGQCVCCGGGRLEGSPAVLMPFVASRVFGHEPVEITAEWGLRDLRPGMAYTVSKSLHCLDCGLLFLDWRFTDAQMAALYRGYRDEQYTRERDHFEAGYATGGRLDFHVRHAYIADVEVFGWHPGFPSGRRYWISAAATGINSPFGGAAPCSMSTMSPVLRSRKARRRSGTTPLRSRDMTFVVCCQVLEHVPFPLDLLESMLPALGPSTLLYLEVPREPLMRNASVGNLRSANATGTNTSISSANPSLQRLCERAGLEVLAQHLMAIDLGARQGEIMGPPARRI